MTGAPVRKMRKSHLMITYGNLMFLSHPLRYYSKKLTINLNADFHWRNKLLSNPQTNKSVELLSIMELDETFCH